MGSFPGERKAFHRGTRVSPTDVDAALLFEQDVGDLAAVELQVVLNVSAPGAGLLLLLSGERQQEVAQSTAGDEALQLLPGQR